MTLFKKVPFFFTHYHLVSIAQHMKRVIKNPGSTISAAWAIRQC